MQPGQTVAVIGLGGVGLAAVLGARLAGADEVRARERGQSYTFSGTANGARYVRVSSLSATSLLTCSI